MNEEGLALNNIDIQNILDKLDCKAFCEFNKIPMDINNKSTFFERMQESGLIQKSKGKFAITNLGAILWAKNLTEFSNLRRKIPRLIVYKDKNRLNAQRELSYEKGYALSIPSLIGDIFRILPANEKMGEILRREFPLYPTKAVRELVVNALIHQDFMMTGANALVEIFEDRIEIRNPGKPLVSTQRFIDAHPQSRNEHLAREMRLLGFCEERGSGIDMVVSLCEAYQLPPPLFSETENSTSTVIFAPKAFNQMDKKDRIRAAYFHACLKAVNGEFMTNSSLRERFKISKPNYPQVSRIIQDAIKADLIVFKDPASTVGRNAKYVPFWAKNY